MRACRLVSVAGRNRLCCKLAKRGVLPMLRWLCSSFVVLSLTAARLPEVRQVGSTPLWFEPNVGQVKGKTEWMARAAGAYLYITGAEIVFALPPLNVPRIAPAKPLYTHNVHMRLVGASAGVR